MAWFNILTLVLATGISSYFYSLYLGYIFDRSKIESEAIYSTELLGSLTGMFVAILLIQWGQWWYCSSLIIVSLISTLYVPTWRSRRIKWFSAVVLLLGAPFLAMWLEPKLKVNYSVRDFRATLTVEELERKWDVHSIVQLLKVTWNGGESRKISVGSGLSLIDVENYENHKPPLEMELAAYFKPRRTLILFAGAGNEISAMRRLNPSALSITGIELSPHVIELGNFGPRGKSTGDDRLVASEARGFLERDKGKYDQIIFSWSGAGVVHSPGTAFQTTSYVYTLEGIRAALAQLNDYGTLIFFGGPIYQVGLALKALSERDLKDSSVVFGFKNRRRNVAAEWDNRIVIYKKGVISLEDRENLQKISAMRRGGRPSMELDNEVEPFHPSTIQVAQNSNGAFSLRHDDNPFVYYDETCVIIE